jgi:hypothetical protein
VETFRVLAARNGDRTEGILPRLISIENLEETRIAALERTINLQMRRKEDYDRKIPTDHGIREQGLVLFYDNRHKEFPGKLHTRWMGPYRVCQILPNGSLQLENLQGQWLDTRVNGSRVKRYTAIEPFAFASARTADCVRKGGGRGGRGEGREGGEEERGERRRGGRGGEGRRGREQMRPYGCTVSVRTLFLPPPRMVKTRVRVKLHARGKCGRERTSR